MSVIGARSRRDRDPEGSERCSETQILRDRLLLGQVGAPARESRGRGASGWALEQEVIGVRSQRATQPPGADVKINRRIAAGAAAAATFCLVATAAPASAHDEQADANGLTTVVLNQGLVGALVGLGVAPVRPGTLTAPGGTYQVAFPITSIQHGRIGHSGGLDFSQAAAGDVKITRFVVDTQSGYLTARAKVNGRTI